MQPWTRCKNKTIDERPTDIKNKNTEACEVFVEEKMD